MTTKTRVAKCSICRKRSSTALCAECEQVRTEALAAVAAARMRIEDCGIVCAQISSDDFDSLLIQLDRLYRDLKALERVKRKVNGLIMRAEYAMGREALDDMRPRDGKT